MWTLKLSKHATQTLEMISGKYRIQVENGLEALSNEPRAGKALVGDLKGYWSFRVGIYRIIYSINDAEIVIQVLYIHHRKEVYEKMRR